VKFGGLRCVHPPSTLILPRAGFPVSSTFVPSSPTSTYVVHLSSAYTGATAYRIVVVDIDGLPMMMINVTTTSCMVARENKCDMTA